jgi:hypothetical protein
MAGGREIVELAKKKGEFSAFFASSAVKWFGKPMDTATPAAGLLVSRANTG